MSKKQTDISQIRKYLKGELDAHAMHQLERRAQDDPFLMDAVEGYEKAGKDPRQNLKRLTERLNKRTTAKVRRMIPWRLMAVAASVLVVFTIGGYWLLNQREGSPRVAMMNKQTVNDTVAAPVLAAPEPKNEVAAARKPEPVRQSYAMQPPRLAKAGNRAKAIPPPVSQYSTNANVKPENTDKDSTPINEMVVLGYAEQKKKAATDKSVDTNTASQGIAKSPEQVIPGHVNGLSVTSSNPRDNDYKYALKNIVSGQVIAKDDGLPVPGATVKLAGSNTSAVTGVDGKFSIRVDSTKKNKLVIADIGYRTREVATKNRDSLKTISLEPNTNSLNEVVVTGNNLQGNDNGAGIDSHPAKGWGDFRKYLKTNAASPDGKKGAVKLSFMVDPSGSITGVKVSKGLSAATDQKAIDMITNGPAWVGSSSGRTEKVTVRIKFSK